MSHSHKQVALAALEVNLRNIVRARTLLRQDLNSDAEHAVIEGLLASLLKDREKILAILELLEMLDEV